LPNSPPLPLRLTSIRFLTTGEPTEGCSSSTSGDPPRSTVASAVTQGPSEVHQGGDGTHDRAPHPSSRCDRHRDLSRDSPSGQPGRADRGVAAGRGDSSREERSRGSASPVSRSSSWERLTHRPRTSMSLAEEARSLLSLPSTAAGGASERRRDEVAISPRSDRPAAPCAKQSLFWLPSSKPKKAQALAAR
jgi:hypothetical protein